MILIREERNFMLCLLLLFVSSVDARPRIEKVPPNSCPNVVVRSNVDTNVTVKVGDCLIFKKVKKVKKR